jgi:hypothetical protein
MQLNERQRLILAGVLKDQRGLINLPVGGDVGLSRDHLGRRRIIVRDAQAGLVPMNLGGWLGHVPSNSECVLFHREYLRLEGMGLLERHNLHGGRRTSHLKLMPAGRRIAAQMLAEEDGRDAGDIDETIDWSSVEFLPIEMPPETDEVRQDAQ